ncbi:hypothetical protein RBXJA2T_01680 [Rubrivivax benzoatilyticus JA2 = ATCC BAA-35]|nr:hypothetical protein RBXJA2T_01680 [Rubrivivax benzoatilyticus JA2 = ATCC BAA-35]
MAIGSNRRAQPATSCAGVAYVRGRAAGGVVMRTLYAFLSVASCRHLSPAGTITGA